MHVGACVHGTNSNYKVAADDRWTLASTKPTTMMPNLAVGSHSMIFSAPFKRAVDRTIDTATFNAEVSQTFRDILPVMVRDESVSLAKCFPRMLWTALTMFDPSLSSRTAEFYERVGQEPDFAEGVDGLLNVEDWTNSNWAGIFPLSTLRLASRVTPTLTKRLSFLAVNLQYKIADLESQSPPMVDKSEDARILRGKFFFLTIES